MPTSFPMALPRVPVTVRTELPPFTTLPRETRSTRETPAAVRRRAARREVEGEVLCPQPLHPQLKTKAIQTARRLYGCRVRRTTDTVVAVARGVAPQSTQTWRGPTRTISTVLFKNELESQRCETNEQIY